jgi:DNA processing protein
MIDRSPAGALILPRPQHTQTFPPAQTSLYPALLARIADPPPHLWVRGDPSAFAAPCVALVGSRAASPYGLQVAERLAADLARAGVTVVSGLARGIDSAAHRGALTAGRTVAVLGSGHFPRRNRLISGLSLAVVVIEASIRSGSLQTARFGLEQGREVLAVPGSILGDRFGGSHALLRDGAKLVVSASDILEELRPF